MPCESIDYRIQSRDTQRNIDIGKTMQNPRVKLCRASDSVELSSASLCTSAMTNTLSIVGIGLTLSSRARYNKLSRSCKGKRAGEALLHKLGAGRHGI